MSSFEKNFLRVAKCGRAIGLNGEITLWPISNIEQRFLSGSEFYVEDGTKLVIEDIRPSKDHFIVRFSGFEDRSSAQGIVNLILYVEPGSSELLEEGEYFHHDCIGKMVIDQDGNRHGVVEKTIESAASDLMQIGSGALIPFRFIQKIQGDEIYVEVPEGLFDIFDREN